MGPEENDTKNADLTDEELAALADEEGGDGDEATTEPEAKKPEGEEGEGEKKPEGEAEEQDDGESRGQFETDEPAPILRARAPEDADAKLNALNDEATALESRFDDGEITASEYRKGLAEIEEKRHDIRWDKQKAELASTMQEQARVNSWNGTVRDFMTTDGADIAKSKAAMIAFDEFVKEVTGDPKNAGLSDRQQLEKAHKLFIEDMGALAPKPKAKQPAGEGDNQPEPKPARKLPPTLGRVPASQIESTDDGKYAALDRLAASDPEAYEDAVAKMSPQEVEEYANSR